MTELKTLSPEDTYETARAKAIKWIKNRKERIKELENSKLPEKTKQDFIQQNMAINIAFIKFFNLTEEDLK